MPDVARQSRLRRWTWRLLKWTGGALVVLLGIYGVLAWRYWSNPPQIKRNYAAELNAKILATPESDRAWPLYREAINEIHDDFVPLANSTGALAWEPPSEELAQFFDRHNAAFAKVRRATKLPALGVPYTDALRKEDWPAGVFPSPYSEDFPTYGEPSKDAPFANCTCKVDVAVLVLMRMLNDQARLAVQRRNSALLCENVVAVIRASRQVSGTVSPATRGIISSSLAILAVALGADHSWLQTEHLKEIEKALREIDVDDLSSLTDIERSVVEDIVQRIFADNGRGDGWYFASRAPNVLPVWQMPGIQHHWAAAPLTALCFPGRRETTELYDAAHRLNLERYQRASLFSDAKRADEAYEHLKKTPIYEVVQILYPHWSKLIGRKLLFIQRRDAVLIAMALARYHHDHNSWPKRLDELVPAYLPEIGLDRFTGKPLSYAMIDGQPTIYSVGPDLRDDHGRPCRYEISRVAAIEIGLFKKEPPPVLDGDGVVVIENPSHALEADNVTIEWRWFEDGSLGEVKTKSGDWILWPILPKLAEN